MDEARFELRFWPKDSTPIAACFAAHWHRTDSECRTDTYIIPHGQPVSAIGSYLAKLRGGTLLDIKRIFGLDGELQQWSPVFSREFPIAKTAHANLSQMLVPPPIMTALRTPDALLSFYGNQPDCQLVEIRKQRASFRNGNVSGEVTRVSVLENIYETVALESNSAGDVRAAAHEMGLGDVPNTHYGAFLRELLPGAGD